MYRTQVGEASLYAYFGHSFVYSIILNYNILYWRCVSTKVIVQYNDKQ